MAGDGGLAGNKDDILANLKTKAKKHEVLDGELPMLINYFPTLTIISHAGYDVSPVGYDVSHVVVVLTIVFSCIGIKHNYRI